MEEWNIQNRSHQCSVCTTPFVDQQVCFTILQNGTPHWVRQDLCENCWNAGGGSMIRDRAGVISHWQGTYEPPAPPPPDPLPRADAESLLRKMMERNDPTEDETRYILAVMLERKRVFKHRETKRDTGKFLVYEHVKTGETFVIRDPEVKLDHLVEVQRRVAGMLKGPAEQPAAAS